MTEKAESYLFSAIILVPLTIVSFLTAWEEKAQSGICLLITMGWAIMVALNIIAIELSTFIREQKQKVKIEKE